LVVLVAMRDGSQQILTNEEGDIYLAQTVMTMTVTIEHLYRARLSENHEVNYAGHPNAYNFLIVIKN